MFFFFLNAWAFMPLLDGTASDGDRKRLGGGGSGNDLGPESDSGPQRSSALPYRMSHGRALICFLTAE